MKPQKPGESPTSSLPISALPPPPPIIPLFLPDPLLPYSPGFGNGNGLAAGAFPGAVAQPGKVGEEHGADKAGSALRGSSPRLPQGRMGDSLEVDEKDH